MAGYPNIKPVTFEQVQMFQNIFDQQKKQQNTSLFQRLLNAQQGENPLIQNNRPNEPTGVFTDLLNSQDNEMQGPLGTASGNSSDKNSSKGKSTRGEFPYSEPGSTGVFHMLGGGFPALMGEPDFERVGGKPGSLKDVNESARQIAKLFKQNARPDALGGPRYDEGQIAEMLYRKVQEERMKDFESPHNLAASKSRTFGGDNPYDFVTGRRGALGSPLSVLLNMPGIGDMIEKGYWDKHGYD